MMKRSAAITWVILLMMVVAPGFSVQSYAQEENIKIIKSTNDVLDFEITIPEYKLSGVKTRGYGEFHRITPPRSTTPITLASGGIDNFSMPEVPVYKTYVALPIFDGRAKIEVSAQGRRVMGGVKLYPIQKPTRDAIGAKDNEEFQFDEKVYMNSPVRHGVAEWKALDKEGKSDDNIYELKLNLVDYYPEKETLVTYDTIRVSIHFEGDVRFFSRIRKNANKGIAPMDDVDQYLEAAPSLLENMVLNKNVYRLERYEGPFEFLFRGARFIIVTHPDFINAANDLKAHKETLGISTKVVKTAAGATAASIKSYLENAYNNWLIRPRWVLFMGDAEFIPTHYGNANTWDNADNAGDIYYGQFTGDDTSIPLFGIGRLPVDTQDQAQVIVDKIKAYENNPPTYSFLFDNPFYYRLTFAAEFQDTNAANPVPDGQAVRWFAETSEHIATYLESQSMSIDRVYKASSPHDPERWQDGTPIPANLETPGFLWDGDRNDIINAVNSGTSILYHRDHGWWSSWGTPSFSTGDLTGISVTNNEFPVVYSINCASGIFDNETDNVAYGTLSSGVYFAEAFLRKADGAIAVIGDTRSSSTVLNNDLAKGLFDATFCNYLPFGAASPITRLGDILNHAKAYVKSRGYDNASTRQELKIYNLLGDPTLNVLSRKPRRVVIRPITLEKELLRIPFVVKELYFEEPCLKCPPVIGVIMASVGKTEVVVGRAVLPRLDEENEMQINIDTRLVKELGATELRVVISGASVVTTEQIIKL